MTQYRSVILRQLYREHKSCEVLIQEGSHLIHPVTRRYVEILEFIDDRECLIEHPCGKVERVATGLLLNPIGLRQTAAINGSKRSKILALRMRAGLIHD